MHTKILKLFENVKILSISNFASKILVFLLVPLYTRLLTPAEYGTYDLVVSTIYLLYPVLTLNIVDAVMRFSMDKNYDKISVARIGFKFVLYSCIITGFLLFFVSSYKLNQNIYGLEFLMFLYYSSYAFNQFFFQLAKGLEKVKDMAIAGVIGTITMVISNLFLLLVLKLGLEGFFIANILSQFIPICYFFVKLKILDYIKNDIIDGELPIKMLTYCIPLIATVLGWWINSTSDKYIVTILCGVNANGILSVAYKIPQIINTLQGIFVQAWQISAIKEYGEDNTPEFYGKTFITINFFMSISCSFLIIFTKPLAAFLFAKDFYVSWKYVPFLLLSCVINCSSGLLGPILAAKKESIAMMWSAIIGAGSNIILNYKLIHIFGIQGATIATILSSYIIYSIRK